jgi:hypothetical protein
MKHELTKHVGVDCFYVQSVVQDKITALQYVPSKIQLANLLTNIVLKASVKCRLGDA